jgi:hypothetical protein
MQGALPWSFLKDSPEEKAHRKTAKWPYKAMERLKWLKYWPWL